MQKKTGSNPGAWRGPSASRSDRPDIREGMNRTELNETIAPHAESAMLYDQPQEDKNRVWVTGPFTVESL